MNAQQLVGQFGREGWAGLEIDPKSQDDSMRKMMAAAQAEAAPVAAALSTPEGQRLLSWLISKTLLRPPSDHEVHAQTAEHYAILKARREGQNGVVFMLLHALQVASGQQQPRSET